MALTYGPNLGLLINGLQGESHYSALMAFFRGSDFFGMPRIQGYLTNTPPAGVDGNAYVIGAAPTGAWAGQAGKIARYNGTESAWEFLTPKEGWQIQNGNTNVREIYRYTNSAWEIFYQEGTWTPALKFGGNSVGMTQATAAGRFTKVGRTYHVQCQITLSAKGTSTGDATITGLPANALHFYALPIAYFQNLTAPGSPTALATTSSSSVLLKGTSGNSSIDLTDANFTATSSIYLSGTYDT